MTAPADDGRDTAPPVQATLAALGPERLRQANINPVTGLATDYLNHFNEIAMLLEMLPAAPEMAEDVLSWEPVPYKEHFERTGFREKALVAEAFDAAPARVRNRFLSIVAAIEEMVAAAQVMIRATPEAIPALAGATHAKLTPLIARAGAVVNGFEAASIEDEAEAQASIDAVFGA